MGFQSEIYNNPQGKKADKVVVNILYQIHYPAPL